MTTDALEIAAAIDRAADKAAPLFAEHGWQWAGLSQGRRIPSKADIVQEFSRLVRCVRREKSDYWSCGRLTVCRFVYPDLAQERREGLTLALETDGEVIPLETICLKT